MRKIFAGFGWFLIAVAFAAVATAGSIKLSWDHSVGGERAFYRVYLGSQPGIYKAVSQTPWNQARITGLRGGQAYYVTVRSVNDLGIEGENSSAVRVDLPFEALALTVSASSAERMSWGDLIAPATLSFNAIVGVPLDQVDKVEVWIGYRNWDGSNGRLYQELRAPSFSAEVSGIGGASQFAIVPYLVLKSGQKIQGPVNDQDGLPVRIHPRVPRHLLRVTPSDGLYLVSNPVTLGLLVDEVGMPVRTVRFKRGNVVLGEDSTPPYSFDWTNTVPGYSEVYAEVFYNGLEAHLFVPSNSVGIQHVRPLARSDLQVEGIAAGTVFLRGLLTNCEGLQVSKIQFLEGTTVIAEDAAAPYEATWQTTPGKVCELTCRAVFNTGHVLVSSPITTTVPGGNPVPTVVVQVAPSTEPRLAPATIALNAAVTAQGNTIQKVQFLADGVVLGEDATAPYALTWSNVTAGTRAVVARVFYGSSLTVNSAAVSVVVVNPAPAVAVSTGTAPSGGWVAPATIALNAAVTAQGNTIQKVQFLADGVVLGEDATAPYALTWSNVTVGTRAVVARVFYGSNQTADSAAVNVVVGNLVPTVAVSTGTAPSGGWVAPATITLNAAVTAQGNTIQKVQFLADGVVLGEDATAPYALTWSNVTVGTRAVVARVFYGSNQTVNSAAVSVVVGSLVPMVTVSTGTAPSRGWVAPAKIALYSTVTPQGNTIQKVQFLANGVVLEEDARPPYALTWQNVTAGTWSVVARVFYGSNRTVDSEAVSVVVVNPVPAVITKGLVAYYPFNGNADDASGSRRHGVVQGPVPAPDRFGKGNAAYRFNGASPTSGKPSRITTPQAASFANGFTASVWISGSPDLKTENYILGSGLNGSRWIGLRTDRRAATSVGRRVLNAEGITTTGSKSIPAQPSSPAPMEIVADGVKWTHVVLTVGDRKMTVFVDGKLSDSTPVGTLRSPPSDRIVIGDFEDATTGACWNGCIDDVRIYNRALSESDVRVLFDYESQAPAPTVGGGGVRRYPLLGATASAAQDSIVSQPSDVGDAGVGDDGHTQLSILEVAAEAPVGILASGNPGASTSEAAKLFVLDVVAEEGADVVIETATQFSDWTPMMRIVGGGARNPIRVPVRFDDPGRSRFWRVRVP